MKYLNSKGVWKEIKVKPVADTLPIGTTTMFSGNTPPSNWLLCDGREVSREYYAELFGVIGTTYGAGNGSTTFNLPNLKGKIPVGMDASDSDFKSLGKTGGSKTHKHTVKIGHATWYSIPLSESTNGLFIENEDGSKSTTNYGAYVTPETRRRNGALSASHTSFSHDGYATYTTGKTWSENTMSPYVVTNYIIKALHLAPIDATVINSLENSSSTDALSARQGKILMDLIQGESIYTGRACLGDSITLSKSCAEFKRVKIKGFGDYGAEVYYEQELSEPNGKSIVISTRRQGSTLVYASNQTLTFSGNKVTFGHTSTYQLGSSGVSNYSTNQYGWIKVTEIIGYNY